MPYANFIPTHPFLHVVLSVLRFAILPLAGIWAGLWSYYLVASRSGSHQLFPLLGCGLGMPCRGRLGHHCSVLCGRMEWQNSGRWCRISATSRATLTSGRAQYQRQDFRLWFLPRLSFQTMLVGRLGVLAYKWFTRTMGLLGFMGPAFSCLFQKTQKEKGRWRSKIMIRGSRFFLRAFCPLPDGGLLHCRRTQDTFMEIGGCCVCLGMTIAVHILVTIANPYMALKQSGQWLQLVTPSIGFLGPSAVPGNADSAEHLAAFVQWLRATSGPLVLSVPTQQHRTSPCIDQEQIGHIASWTTGCTMWSLVKRRLRYPQHIVPHTQFADNVVMPRTAGTGIMAMIRMGVTPMTLQTVICHHLDSVGVSGLSGMNDDSLACTKHSTLVHRVSLKTSEDSPRTQQRRLQRSGMSSWNTGWQSRAPATAQWSQHPSARQGGT